MAYAKQTFNDVLTSVAYRYGETSVPASGIDNWKHWANKGVEYCAERLDLKKSVSITTINDVCVLNASITDPAMDFKSVSKLVDVNGRVIPISNNYERKVASAYTFSLTGDHATGITLHAADGTYTLYYNFYPAPMVSLTDVCIIPDGEAVSAFVYAQIRRSETDPLNDVEKNLQEVENRINKMSEELSKNEGDLRFKPLF